MGRIDRNNYRTNDENIVRTVFDDVDRQYSHVSPYRFRVVVRDGGPLGHWVSVEELIDDRWMGLVIYSHQALINELLECAILASS